MIIVIEGPDSAGKTTLAKYLSKELAGIYIKSYHRPPEVSLYHRILLDADVYAPFVISDRHPVVSEFIYGRILRGGYSIHPMDIEEYVNRVHAFVYCRVPLTTLQRNIHATEQMAGVRESIGQIIQAYSEFFTELHIERRVLIQLYDYTRDDPRNLVLTLREYAEAHKL